MVHCSTPCNLPQELPPRNKNLGCPRLQFQNQNHPFRRTSAFHVCELLHRHWLRYILFCSRLHFRDTHLVSRISLSFHLYLRKSFTRLSLWWSHVDSNLCFIRVPKQEHCLLHCQHTFTHLGVLAAHLWVSLRTSLRPQLPPYQLAKTSRDQKTTYPLRKGHYSFPMLRSSSSQEEKAGWAGRVGGNGNKRKMKGLNFISWIPQEWGDLGKGQADV